MFKFSCFHSPALSPKPKKTVQLPTEAMGKILEDNNTNKPYKDPVFSKEVHESNNVNPFPCSAGQEWKSEGLKISNDTGSDTSKHGHELRAMRKCASLGTGLAAYQDITSHEDSSSCHGNRSRDKYQKSLASVSAQKSSNLVNHASDLSPDHLQRSRTPCNPHTFVKSNSLPYLHLVHTNVVRQSRSSDDLKALDTRWDDKPVHTDAVETLLEQEIEDYSASHADRSIQEDHSVYQYEELPNEDYKIKRIEKWVIDLQHSSLLEETNMLTDVDHHEQSGKGAILDPILASRNDAKAILGMDAAKRYISSLNAAATTAQLANHGLVAIPFLSAFLSLRVLNLSGNSIVRITVGALPRGLHILNLSKNSISTIEGLRELTRLRILDLSYNRILRIGHGLALCSSLKELYMAGNKISEVEGLHRLLKLNVLDLRFNKLSTTKNLGQLAANYSSLQAISLEGNPAQKNIGDEQLKKFVLGLLPHIAYFNRHSIKSGGMKDAADRAARLGISAHQTDRGVKPELKTSTHGRKSQVVNVRGRHVRLPPSGVKAIGDGQQFRDASSRLVSFSPDLAMRRTHSEGLLRAV